MHLLQEYTAAEQGNTAGLAQSRMIDRPVPLAYSFEERSIAGWNET